MPAVSYIKALKSYQARIWKQIRSTSPWWIISIGLHIIIIFLLSVITLNRISYKEPYVVTVSMGKANLEKPADLTQVPDLLANSLPKSPSTPPTDEPAIFFPGAKESDHNESDDNNPLHHEMKGDSKDFLSYIPGEANGIRGNLPGKTPGVYDVMGVGGGAGGGGRYGGRAGGMQGLVIRRGMSPPSHGGSRPPNAEPYDAMFFKSYGVNPFVDTEDDHLSTFATDIDTASYTIARTYLKDGNLPPPEAIRTEEFINFFDYNYQPPEQGKFAIHIEAAPSKFGKNCFLQRIGIRGKDIAPEKRKDANLTFVIDVSGSMGQYDNRLELVKKSLRQMIDQLRDGDRIGIVVYTTNARILMEPTGIADKSEILSAIDSLRPEASTNAEDGLRLGFEMADRSFRQDCINRIILCTDGVANEGQTGAEEILKGIKKYTDKGIYLTALGFGMQNYNDVLLQQLGDKGNGHYAYIDNIMEAKRILVENLTGVLQVVAKDVKVQMDFNPKVVRSYRLIGYEKRDVADNKFRDDQEDGGEIGSGFSVTALYEVKLWENRSGKSADNPTNRDKMATLYVRAKNPNNDEVKEVSREINTADIKKTFEQASDSFKLSACAAEFGEILRQSYWAKDNNMEDVLQLAQSLSSAYKSDAKVIELTDLISKAKTLIPKKPLETAQNNGSDDE